MREAKPEEVLLQDGSIHSCEDAAYYPLAYINGARYFCSKCGQVIQQDGNLFRATSQVINLERAKLMTVEPKGGSGG